MHTTWMDIKGIIWMDKTSKGHIFNDSIYVLLCLKRLSRDGCLLWVGNGGTGRAATIEGQHEVDPVQTGYPVS